MLYVTHVLSLSRLQCVAKEGKTDKVPVRFRLRKQVSSWSKFTGININMPCRFSVCGLRGSKVDPAARAEKCTAGLG
jgi:hypothetical protein